MKENCVCAIVKLTLLKKKIAYKFGEKSLLSGGDEVTSNLGEKGNC
jgi:hypothetical protein